jgi:hypothetical protein
MADSETHCHCPMDLTAIFCRRCWRKQIIPKFLFILIYFADFSGFACLIGGGPDQLKGEY